LLILSVIFISLNACCSDPEIVYIEKEIIIPDNIPPTPLNSEAPLTENEYILMIDSLRKDILYCEILKNAGKITEEEFSERVDSINKKIEKINALINNLADREE